MRAIILITSCLIALTNLRATEPLPGAALIKTIDWSKEPLPPEARLDGGSPETGPFISVTSPGEKPVSVTLLSIKTPGISTKCYALRGRIRYREVAGIGYLQLWNEFPAESAGAPAPRYFSRTLADVGPMQKIAGSSQWRDAWLPFDATQSKSLPNALQLDVVLPGRGTVDLTNLEIIQFADAGAMWAAMSGSGGSGSVPGWLPGTALGTGIVALAVAIFVRRRKVAEMRRMRAMDYQ